MEVELQVIASTEIADFDKSCFKFEGDEGVFLLGRDPAQSLNNVPLHHKTANVNLWKLPLLKGLSKERKFMSRIHAEIAVFVDKNFQTHVKIYNHSTNKTRVNGFFVPENGFVLEHRDIIQIGRSQIRIEILYDDLTMLQESELSEMIISPIKSDFEKTPIIKFQPEKPTWRTNIPMLTEENQLNATEIKCMYCGKSASMELSQCAHNEITKIIQKCNQDETNLGLKTNEEHLRHSLQLFYIHKDCADKLYNNPPKFEEIEIEKPIGQGGMGIVYLTHFKKNPNKKFVMKLFLPVGKITPGGRFRREISIMKILSNSKVSDSGVKNIAKFYTMGERDWQIFFIMEYISGGNFAEYIKSQKTGVKFKEAVQIIIEALHGLWYINSNGIVHRDIKPENILLGDRKNPTKTVKIADFGIARAFKYTGNSLADKLSFQLSLSTDIDFYGTPKTVAPEQIEDFRNVGPAADIYAMAATLYMAITGKSNIYDKINSKNWMFIIGSSLPEFQPMPINKKTAQKIPKKLVEVIMNGLIKDPHKRTQSAKEFARQLAESIEIADPNAWYYK